MSGAFADDPNYKDGYSNQWNVEVQRELGSRMMLSVAYVGSRNGRLAYTGYANAAPTPSPNGTPAAAIDALRAVPWMVANIHYTESIGSSHYNALQTKFERRLANGFQTLISYTWSKSIDNTSGYFGVEDGAGSRSSVQNFFDPASNEGPSGFDGAPHRSRVPGPPSPRRCGRCGPDASACPTRCAVHGPTNASFKRSFGYSSLPARFR